jgi:hypothetical protein
MQQCPVNECGFLRAVQLANGQWVCRPGLIEFDTHDELDHAVRHLRRLAAQYSPAQLFVPRLDGTVECLS